MAKTYTGSQTIKLSRNNVKNVFQWHSPIIEIIDTTIDDPERMYVNGNHIYYDNSNKYEWYCFDNHDIFFGPVKVKQWHIQHKLK